jgi:hypothetical protein
LQHFFDWSREHLDPGRPWLILGKGPSFGLRTRIDLSGYHLLSLNHVVREQPVLLAHMIDLDVVDACGEALLRQADYVVLPWYPHTQNAPGTQSLEVLVPSHQLLRRLDDAGRLLWYDLSTAPGRHGPGPVVQATYFSAEAAVSLLAQAGVRRVRSLGVDGGAAYSGEFADLEGRTLLANGRPAFDLQFQGIARTILRTGIDFAPLDLPAPIIVLVPANPSSALPAKVLEFAVRKRTSMTVQVCRWVGDGGVAGALEPVSEADGFRRAIVLSPSALVLDDLRKVWGQPFEREGIEVPESSMGDTRRVAPAMAVVTAADSQRFEQLCRRAMALVGAAAGGPDVGPVLPTLPARWNHPDRFDPSDTAVVHFAAPELQPWVSRAHPVGHLWVTELLEAVRERFVPADLIRSEVHLGHVRPSLLEQVERGLEESLLVPRSVRRRDATFAPRGGPMPVSSGLLSDPLLVLRALGRQARRRVNAYRQQRAARRGSA